MAWFDSLANRLVPTGEGPFALSEEDKRKAFRRGLLESGLATLATPTGTGSTGMGIARGLLAGTQGIDRFGENLQRDRYFNAQYAERQAKAEQEKAAAAAQQRLAELQRASFNPDGTVNQTGLAQFRAEFPMEAIAFLEKAQPKEDLPSDVETALYAMQNPQIIDVLARINNAKAPPNLQYIPGLGQSYDPRNNTFVNVGGGQPVQTIPQTPDALPERGVRRPVSVDDAIANIEMKDGPLAPEIKAQLREAMMSGDGNFSIPAPRQQMEPAPNPVVMQPDAPLEIAGSARAWWRTATPEQRQQFLDRESGAAPQISSARPTEDMSKAAGWLSQAQLAIQNMKEAVKLDQDANRASMTERVVGTVPFAGDVLERMVQTPERQRYVNASSSLAEAVLRAATGAGVNQDEARQKVQELTPQIGDKDEVVAQKMAAAENYLRALEARAGNAALPSPGLDSEGWKIEVIP
jgi:hypothetical protein